MSLLLLGVFWVNICLGSVWIPLEHIVQILLGGESKDSWENIVLAYRLPKAVTAILVGAGLAVSGLLMQTLFRNPLAGPFVLGLSSGASLGVALLVMGASLFGSVVENLLLSHGSFALAATVGSFLVLLAVVTISYRVKDTMAILIIGLMFGNVTAAVVNVLSFFATAEELQQYIFWSFGSLGNLSWRELALFSLLVVFGIALAIRSIKALNSFLLGENYARSLGVSVKKTRLLVIIATSLLAGSVTAFAGPIAFVGLAVPHLTRLVFNTSNHKILLPAVIIFGAMLMLVCDSVAQLPRSEMVLPINAITSLIGAPVVIWLLVRKRKMMF